MTAAPAVSANGRAGENGPSWPVSPKLTIDGVRYSVGGRRLVDDVAACVGARETVGLLGPNGSGKTTLLKTVYRVLAPDAGLITLDGDDIWRLPQRTVAQRMAVVLQEASVEFDFSVEEIVTMGRTPHKGLMERDSAHDRALVSEVLERVGVGAFARRSFATLSGGEKQRVLIARALAHEAKLLLLDEPTNHLDVRYQHEILSLVRGLGVAALAALHDLNLAAAYCDRLYVLANGQVVTRGTPEEVLTPELIASVFGIRAEVFRHPHSAALHVLFHPAQ